ncbi:AAA family ATPase [Salsipaludibacter albus]|uniref:AAA family ATPase n=1 Tax=Salsipaludibacter albus TaxID=2849650 RepID=UPI001EE4C4FC|nr:ATP-binding protein [Salsipaludibacter albus]
MSTRDPGNDPFTPGYGVVPQVFAGRQAEFADFEGVVLRRVAHGTYEPARLLTGDRGMGKTALLKQFEAEGREAGHWVARISAVRGDAALPDLVEAVVDALDEAGVAVRLPRAAKQALKRTTGITVGPTGIAVGDRAPSRSAVARWHKDLTAVLVGAAGLAREAGVALLAMLDEAQNIDRQSMGALFHAFQEAQSTTVTEHHDSGARLRHHLPLAIYVAGLPGLTSLLRAAGTTFGERARHVQLLALSDNDVGEAFTAFAATRGITVDADAGDAFVEVVGGYPYFLHVVGSRVWVAGDGPVITREQVVAGWEAARPTIEAFYEDRLKDITDTQRRYLEAAAALDESDRTSGAIAAALDATTESVGSTQQSLIDTHGLLRRSGRGKVAFTLPGMDRHLRG